MSAWRRENSNAMMVLVVLADGTQIRGTILVPRDKTLRDVLIQPEPFFDVECQVNGTVLVSKPLVRTVRSIDMPKGDQLDNCLRALEKMDVYGILKLDKTATVEQVKQAAKDEMRRFPIPLGGTSVLPKEVLEYMGAMRKRIEIARDEVLAAIAAASERTAAKDANMKAMQRPVSSSGAANASFGGRVKATAA
jgi:K+/H+ antiporter YhaU regulatory subunit KhtT